jgi:hypothetical protein
VEKRCSPCWSLAAAGGLLALAVLAGGVGLRAADPAADQDPKKDPVTVRKVNIVTVPAAAVPVKKATTILVRPGQVRTVVAVADEDKKPEKADKQKGKEKVKPFAPDMQALEKLLESLPAGADREQVRRELMRSLEQIKRKTEEARKEAEKLGEEARKLARQAGQEYRHALRTYYSAAAQPGTGRLGVQIGTPGAALADQLDLPKGQGLLVTSVVPDSAAGKAGLKVNDILLEWGGKPVTSEPADFAKMVAAAKADEAVDVLVLRKGRKEKLAGVKLPAGRASERMLLRVPVQVEVPKVVVPAAGFPGVFAQGGRNTTVMTTTFRADNRFTTRYQEGSLVITVTGTLADGKAKVGEISVQDGATAHKYDGPDKVAEPYRDKVKHLIEMSEKGAIKIDLKK